MPAQWKDLPYADCTWETAQDIFAAGGQDCVDEFQARLRCFVPAVSVRHRMLAAISQEELALH